MKFRQKFVIFLAVSSIGSALAKEKSTNRYENIEIFQKVLHFVENNYVDPVDNQQLIQGAIKGMLETLDPHSNFLPAQVFRDMKIETSGKFGGIGIEIGMKENVLTVITPIEDTPAWRAGIKPNDRIVKIDQESTKGMTLVEAVAKMRGKGGSSVTLSIFRDGVRGVRDFTVKRELIKIQSVKSELLESGFGYVRLSNFNETAARDIRSAIEKMEKGSKGGKLNGLVFDLRFNPGGLLDQAVDVSSLFMDEGVIVSTIGRNRDQKELKYARKGMARKDLPLAVLVNGSSASASEIVAGALQDNNRALILGQPTFGKGSVQTVMDLGQDMGLKLTIARYYTPSGRSIQEKGVQPDVVLDDLDPKVLAEARRNAESPREKDLKGHMTNPDKNPDYRPEELENLGKKSEKSFEKNSDKKPDDSESEPVKFNPKEDFQVRQALGYLKSFEVFERLKRKPETTKQ
ncbi:S41 family peptidase [bacterium]|nr:S41 family peptidase [bacterium]